MITITPTLHDIEAICTVISYIIAIASFVCNYLPHPEKAEGKLSKISKVINFIALNIKKIEK